MLKHKLTNLFLIAVSPIGLIAQSSPLARSDTTIRSLDGREMKGEVLRLTVPERHARPLHTLTVGALRFRSTAVTPGAPIVFLMGGPGIPGSVMTPIPPYFSLFQRLREIGDVIVIDQRGIGLSSPHVECAASESMPQTIFADTARMIAFMRDQVAVCAAKQRGKNVEPTAYNTVESADDIDALRRALGIAKVHLLAFSYGTRLALATVQRHQSSIGRIVLQGVNGPGLVVKRPGAVARKLARVNDIVKLDSTWTQPVDLVGAARRARDRLSAAPAMVTVTDQRTRQPAQLKVGREGFDAIVSLNIDDVRLPALLVSTANGDDRLLTKFAEAVWNGLSNSPVALMARSVNCAADRPQSRWDLATSESASAPFGSPIDNAFLTKRFCIAVGYPGTPVEFPGPVRSPVPALLITGALDATNPIENAQDVARGLTNSTVLEVSNAAHEALPVDSVQAAVVDFLKGVDVRNRKISASRPHYPTVSEALTAGPRR